MFNFFISNCFSDFFENSKPYLEQVSEINNRDELVKQLKKVYRNGEETSPKQSAHIFHKLGQLYCNQATDMIKLTQSAILYNAALAISPKNADVIKNNLKQLCNQVLSFANAKNINADLISASKQVKQEIDQMRLEV